MQLPGVLTGLFVLKKPRNQHSQFPAKICYLGKAVPIHSETTVGNKHIARAPNLPAPSPKCPKAALRKSFSLLFRKSRFHHNGFKGVKAMPISGTKDETKKETWSKYCFRRRYCCRRTENQQNNDRAICDQLDGAAFGFVSV